MSTPGDGADIHRTDRDGVATLRLDDGRANAIHGAWCDELCRHLDEIEASDAKVVILEGREGFFSAGLDLKRLPDLDPEALSDTMATFLSTMRRLFLFPRPVVAAANGHAIAGGMMLYLAADLRLAVDRPEAKFGLNEATTGIPLLGGTAGICLHSIPPRHHTEMILHGRLVGAAGTAERGITHELVANLAQLSERSQARARALLDLDLDAYRLNKRLLREPAWDAAVATANQIADGITLGNPFANIRR